MAEWHMEPNAAAGFCIALEALRYDEGHSVTILCDDPEAESVDKQCAVEVIGDWTNWEPLRFYGATPLAAILAAGIVQAQRR